MKFFISGPCCWGNLIPRGARGLEVSRKGRRGFGVGGTTSGVVWGWVFGSGKDNNFKIYPQQMTKFFTQHPNINMTSKYFLKIFQQFHQKFLVLIQKCTFRKNSPPPK